MVSSVGVGASAGGLAAFRQLLDALPTDTGMSFILLQHLPPSHESMLADILSRVTSMPVTEVWDEPSVEPNHVYVIPPERSMIISGGNLQLLSRTEKQGQYHPIDKFFRSLAEAQDRNAIGVILSGTTPDGTLGLEEIKGAGGITFVQDDTAQHGGMPQSAIASGCADFVLPPEQIAEEIARIARHPDMTASDPEADSPASSRDPQQAADRVLLARYAPAGVLINADLDILSFHGETAPYLAPAPGKASLNLLKTARQGLPARLHAAIHKARDTQEPVRETDVCVESEDGYREVALEVLPVTGIAASESHFWVLFIAPDRPAAAQAKPKTRKDAKTTEGPADQEIARLTEELDATREDVSDQMQLEQDLHDRLTERAEADRRKNEFLAMLAHELRNPLNALASAAQILNRTDAGGDAAARARDILGPQVDQMARILDDLLDVSRITQGKIELRKAPMELAPMLKGAAETTRHVIAGRSKELTVSLPSQSLWLNADASRLQQAVSNLLSNAVKFTSDDGHIQLMAERVEAGDSGADALAMIRVRDDGIGMTPETLPHVFDLFTQAQTSLDRIQGGLGIGLTLVRQVVERHGGRVEAHSDGVDQGSEFVVRLPVMPAAEADPPADEAAESNTQAPAGTFRILIVDDTMAVAEGLSLVLGLAGHETEIAHNGPAALETAATYQPDALVIDIGLPGMDGYEVARRLRQQQDTSDALLIALSGYAQDEHQRRGIEAGFDYYVAKPVNPEKLLALLGDRRAQ